MNPFRRNSKNAPLTAQDLYQLAPLEALRTKFVGKELNDVEGPAAVLDAAVVRTNCRLMLETCDALNLPLRCHVKTSKCVEVCKMQVGEAPMPVKLVVSTIAEVEYLLPYLLECKQQGREINVLYGIPPSSSSFERLSAIQDVLGPQSISFLIDHPKQLQNLFSHPNARKDLISIFVKVDIGCHRAGVPPESESLQSLLEILSHTQKVTSQPNIKLIGFYCHSGRSYAVSNPEEALDFLSAELEGATKAAAKADALDFGETRFTLSIGATPTVSSAQNLLADTASGRDVHSIIAKAQEKYDVELHAGVYPFLDLQQVATHARPLPGPDASSKLGTMSTADIGLSILAEVLSVYPSDREKPEALIGAGTLALGREPCKAYPGWGIITGDFWKREGKESSLVYNFDAPENERTGWIVSRISQEHGVCAWHGDESQMRQLKVGEKVLVWPNHACIAGAGFGWYLVVDSSLGENERKKVQNVYVRCNGW